MSSSILANGKVRQFAAMMVGVSIGPLSLGLCTALGVSVGSRAHDSVAPIALWLTSPTAQVCAATLLVIGAAVRLAGDLAGLARRRRGVMPEGDRQRAEARA